MEKQAAKIEIDLEEVIEKISKLELEKQDLETKAEDVLKSMMKVKKLAEEKEEIVVAKENDIILITGKGTDPYIMGPDGSKTPWSDADVVRELLS